MDTMQKIALANQILGNTSEEDVIVLKKDKSLIERRMSEKIILTDDNRELLKD